MKNYSIAPAIGQIIIACSMSLIISPLWAQTDDVIKKHEVMTEQRTLTQKDDMEGMDDMDDMD
ncbi:MAG TPA: hypothetical protein DIT31_08030, partial [Methylophaga sp.]|nr:hypothetical protein [Methylophaga sp.]